MADGEESSSSEDSEGSSTSSSSEDLLQACSDEATPGNQDREPSASSSQPAARREIRTWNSARLIGRPENPPGAEARGGPSAESSAKSGGQPKLPMPKLDLRALFDYHSRRKQRRRRRWDCRSPQTEAATKYKIPEPRTKRPRLRASKEKQRKRSREKYLQFPFVRKLYGKERIPLRMECLFEQATVQGFFKYVEKLKFEHHLKKSLAQLDATEDLEKESLESRRHKYLDDDGSLSPIEEGNGEDVNEDCDTGDLGARIVENSVFILSSNIPEKKSRKTKETMPVSAPAPQHTFPALRYSGVPQFRSHCRATFNERHKVCKPLWRRIPLQKNSAVFPSVLRSIDGL